MVDYGGDTKHYKWTQTEDEVSVSVRVPEGLRARDLDIAMKPKTLKVAVKGKETIVDGELWDGIILDKSTWYLDENIVEFSFQKANKGKWWATVIKGDDEIDVDLIEGSKYLDASLLEKVKQAKKEKKEQEAREKAEKEAAAAAASGTTEAPAS